MRTTLLGHMPGWCPDVHAVGPWRGLHLVAEGSVRVEDFAIEATLGEDGTGRLRVALRLPGAPGDTPPVLHCAGWEAPLDKADDGLWSADMLLPGIEAWWPHTHGTPHLHALTLRTRTGEIALGRTGFRRIEVDRGGDGDGFALKMRALLAEHGQDRFKVGEDDDGYAVYVKLKHFVRYCLETQDDSPLYVFDSSFAERENTRDLGRDYALPKFFTDGVQQIAGLILVKLAIFALVMLGEPRLDQLFLTLRLFFQLLPALLRFLLRVHRSGPCGHDLSAE